MRMVREDEAGENVFDVGQYLARSEKLDLSDIDWSEAKGHPVSEAEVNALVYMMDIESHTLCYLRDLLNAGAGADPEIADFLGCWLYEEAYHGRALEKFLRESGIDRAAAVCSRGKPGLRERLEAWGAALLAKLLPQFTTVHMAWGAIQEHSTLKGYTCLARRTRNPLLAEILTRIARQEARHFQFYHCKARQGLRASFWARRITSFFLRRFWTPVGEGVKPASDTDFLLLALFDDASGSRALRRIDETMARLPGLEWFDLMTRRFAAAKARAA